MASNELNQLRAAKSNTGGPGKKPCHYCGGKAEVTVSITITEGSAYSRNLKRLAGKQVRACAACAIRHLDRFA